MTNKLSKTEQYLIKPALTVILKTLFRIKINGIENYHAAGDRVVIISNHQSFLDPLLLSVFTPEKPAFAMNVHQAGKWYFAWVDLLIKTYKIDPLAPMSLKSLMSDVKKGVKVVIFPEGRITTTGGIMKVYDGAGRIVEKTGAAILPVHIEGAQYSKFGRMRRRLKTRFFPQITINFLPPKIYEEGKEISARKIYDMMVNSSFSSSNYRRPILAAIVEAAAQYGDNSKIVTDITRNFANYRQVFTRSLILGNKLEMRIYDEKFIGVLLPNSIGVMVTFIALQMLGKVPAMLNFSAGENNILNACKIATVKTVLTSRVFIEKGKFEHIVTALEKEHKIIYLEDIRPEVMFFDKISALFKAVFIKHTLDARIKNTDADSPAVVLFTSGSEGVPKGVVLSHSNILANINQSCAVLDLTPSDILFNAMPVFHCFGLTVGMLLPLTRGINVFLYPSPVHYRVVPEMVYDSNATILIGTDTFFNGYARYAHPYDFNSVRLAVAGAEKLKESTRRLYADKFCVSIMQGYGVTEASPVISFNTLIEHKEGSVGKAFPAIECKIEPVSGLEKGGRLLIKAPNVMLGYMKIDNVGVIQPQDEWYDTGDIVEIDDDGFITIVGRAKRFAKIAGEMVSLAIAEELAFKLYPDCAHATIAVADERKGENIILCSEYENLSREDLLKLAQDNGLPEISLPKKIIYIQEIPRLGSGKINYPELTEIIVSKL